MTAHPGGGGGRGQADASGQRRGDYEEVANTFLFFGDPATSLKVRCRGGQWA